jgi:hypothetical protein
MRGKHDRGKSIVQCRPLNVARNDSPTKHASSSGSAPVAFSKKWCRRTQAERDAERAAEERAEAEALRRRREDVEEQTRFRNSMKADYDRRNEEVRDGSCRFCAANEALCLRRGVHGALTP